MNGRIGSLCSGYEGLGAAVQSVLGGELAWVADNDPGAAKILAHRYPDVPNHGDITAVDWAEAEPVGILTAGFPCTDVSCAGARAGLREGTRSGVWTHCARAISELRPSLVVIENVRGLLSAGADSPVEPCPWCLGETRDEHALRAAGAVLGDLADIGYDAEWTTVSAADAGAPHRRERIFIVARPAADTQAPGWWRRGGTRSAQPHPGTGESGRLQPEPDDRGEQPPADADSTVERAVAMETGRSVVASVAGLQKPRRDRDGQYAPAEDTDRAASGERRLTGPGEAEGGRPRADAGRPGGAPTLADAEVRRRDDRIQHAVEPGPARAGIAAQGNTGGGDLPPADAPRDGWDEGRPEPARLIGGSDAAVGGDGPEPRCPSYGCPDDFHDSGGFCAGPCGGNCVDPGLGRPDGGWNSFGDDADPAEVRAYALAHSTGIRHGDTGPQGERRIPAATVTGTPADTDGGGRRLDRGPGRQGCESQQLGLRPAEHQPGDIAWGAYEPAIRRWEAVLGRSAPRPTEPGRTGERLSPRFVEFLMGLPDGWVTDVPGLSRNAQLKALGNGVVPQQAAMALRMLLARTDAQEAA